MAKTKLYHQWSNGSHWVLDFVPLQNEKLLAAALSNGSINYYSLQKPFSGSLGTIKAHPNSINKLAGVQSWTDGASDNSGNLLASCSTDSVKVWDIRDPKSSIFEFHNRRNIPFLSVTSAHGLLAAGTELKGSDAEIHVWDLRKPDGSLFKSIVDAQHDDVTDLQFHPTDSKFLLSGSTDGCVNIYDLSQQEEDDVLYQVINFSSIHSAGWLSKNRIYTLSHMETFAIHELNDITVEENIEPQPVEFGDVRESWGCDYVIDVFHKDGYIGSGSINDKNEVKLIKFQDEKVNTKKSVTLEKPHGEEIARCLYVPQGIHDNRLVISGGEDGNINIWKAKEAVRELLDLQDSAKDKSGKLDEDDEMKDEGDNKVKERKSREKKHKSKTKSKSSKHRFKPY